MKKLLVILLSAAMIMALTACGGSKDNASGGSADGTSAVLKAVYENYVKAGSEYDNMKNMYKEYYPDMAFKETLDGDSMTIEITGNEDMNGSWTFKQEGDYITHTAKADDYFSYSLFSYFYDAVAAAVGADKELFNGYVQGLVALELENPYISIETDGENGSSYKLYDAGAYDMKELDDMYVSEEFAEQYLTPVGEDDHFTALPIGKISVVSHGNKDSMDIAVAEYGGFTDDKGYKSLINTVKNLKPGGYKKFLEQCKALEDMEGDGFTVTTSPDAATMEHLGITEPNDNYKYVVVHFGEKNVSDEGSESEEGSASEE